MCFFLSGTVLEDLLQGHSDFKRGAAEISQFGTWGIRNLEQPVEQNLDEAEISMMWRTVKWTLCSCHVFFEQDTK